VREPARHAAGSKSPTSSALGPTPARPLPFSTVPEPIPLSQGGTFNLSQSLAGGVPPYHSFAADEGTLPDGVTIDPDTGIVSAAEDAELPADPEDSDTFPTIKWGADDSATPVSQPGELPLFGVTSAAGGADLPFTAGHVFKQGDIPAGKFIDSDLTDWQATPTTYWPDGSVRHAIIAGRATCTAGVLQTTQLARADADRSGTALTEADLSAALPAVTLECGAGGEVVSLNALVGTAARRRTVCAGPVMSNWVYRKQLAGSTTISVWFDVRLYKGGNVEILPWVENGVLLQVPGDDTRTWTLTIGGTARFSKLITIYAHTRCVLIDNQASSFKHFSYWTGIDPQIEPRHDTDYFMASKMVPHYGFAATESTFSQTEAPITQSFYPGYRGSGMSSDMSGTGFGSFIGLIPNWAAVWLTSGADPRAYRAIVVNGYASGSWRINYRDETLHGDGVQHEPFRYEDYPTIWSGGSGPGPKPPFGTGTVPNYPDKAHQPSMDYVPWLITGRWFHLEQMLFWLTWSHMDSTYTYRGQADGLIFHGQTRARGWQVRLLAQTLAVLPTDHPCYPGLLNSWQKNTEMFEARYVTGTLDSGAWVNNLGVMGEDQQGSSSPYNADAPAGYEGYGWLAPWQFDSAGAHKRLAQQFGSRNLAGFGVADLTGTYCFRYFGAYMLPYGERLAGTHPPLTPYFGDWGEVLATRLAAFGGEEIPCAEGGSITYRGIDVTEGDWWKTSAVSICYASLAMAREHDAAGAAEAWARITGSSSWALASGAFSKVPVWGIYPRNVA